VPASAITPVTVLTGFLGSGKTTLLDRLVRDKRFSDTAILVNEWGEVAIDHALVRASSDNVVVLAGGVTQAGDALFEPLRAEVRRRAFKPAVDACRIVPGSLDGKAGVIGAVATFIQQNELA